MEYGSTQNSQDNGSPVDLTSDSNAPGNFGGIPMSSSVSYSGQGALTGNMGGSVMKGQPSIQVCNPVAREDTLKKYIVYTVRGYDKDGSFDNVRRFSDFYYLRNVLVERWPGVYVPPLPEKKAVGNMQPGFVEDRRRYLETFMIKCSEIPYLMYSEEIQMFLRSKVNDIKTALTHMPKQSFENIISKYTNTFSHLSGKELNQDTVHKIGEFESFLRKILSTFEIYKTQARSICLNKRAYYDSLARFHSNVLVSYETNCVTQYSGGLNPPLVFTHPQHPNLSAQVAEIKDGSNKESFEAMNDLIKQESKEIKAFLDTLEARDKFQLIKVKLQEKVKNNTADLQKVMAGRNTIKTVFSTKSKDQHASDLEVSISDCNRDIEHLNLLHDMMTLILAYAEIDKFREQKIARFLRVTKIMALNEQQVSFATYNFWSNVLKVDSIPADV